jgi:hypothetical protein
LELAQRLLLDEPVQIFSGDLAVRDVDDLKALSTVIGGIAADVAHAKVVGAAIARGDWPALIRSFDHAAVIRDPEWMAAAVTVMLPLPACHIDAFSLLAMGHAPDSVAFCAKRASVEPRWIGRVGPANSRVDQLQRFIVQSILAWRGDFRYFDLRMDEPIERARLARFAASLQVVAGRPDVYRHCIHAIARGAWREAEEAAAVLLASARIAYGCSMDEPPAVADLVLIAFIPAASLVAIRSAFMQLSEG